MNIVPSTQPPEGSSASLKRKQGKWYDYDLSQVQDTKGGFLLPAAHDASSQSNRLRSQKKKTESVYYEHCLLPPVNPHDPQQSLLKCKHCESPDLHLDYHRHFQLSVCRSCIDQRPEQYTLLTQTECQQDYLLTVEEVQSLPCWQRPNPRHKTYAKMNLFVRAQVERFAFEKWKGEEGLDKEWERRQRVKAERKQKVFVQQMKSLRKRTRIQQMHGEGGRSTGDIGVHEHILVSSTSMGDGTEKGKVELVQICSLCGLEVEVDEI